MESYFFSMPQVFAHTPSKIVPGPLERWRNSFLTDVSSQTPSLRSPCMSRPCQVADLVVEPRWVTDPHQGFYFWYPDFQVPVVPEHSYSDALVTLLIEAPVARVWQGLEASSPEMALKKVVTTHPEFYETLRKNPVLAPLVELARVDYVPTNPAASYDVWVPEYLTPWPIETPVGRTSLDATQPYVGLAGATANVYLPGGLITIDDPMKGRWFAEGSFPRSVERLLRREVGEADAVPLLHDVLAELGVIKPFVWRDVPDYPSEKVRDLITARASWGAVKQALRELVPARRASVKTGSYWPVFTGWGVALVSDLLTMLLGGRKATI